MRDFLQIAGALSDRNRVRILLALASRELCVCQVTELLGLATSTISKHLSLLQQAGLIASRKQERWVYYRIADKGSPAIVREAIAWARKSLDSADEARSDSRKLAQVLKTDLAEICRRRCR